MATSPLLLSTRDERIDLPGFRVTRTWRPAGLRLAAHSHEHTNVALCASGSFDEVVGGRWHRVTPATLIIRPGGEPHANRYSSGPSRAIIFELLPETTATLSQATSVLRSVLSIEAGEVVTCARRLKREWAQPDNVSPLAMEAILYDVLVLASRAAESVDDSPAWFKRVVDYLHAHFDRRLRMADLEDVAGVHAAHVAKTFRARQGMTVADYVRRLRITRSTALLKHPDLSLADIATACGFFDQSHFTRAFTREIGTSPHRFRTELG